MPIRETTERGCLEGILARQSSSQTRPCSTAKRVAAAREPTPSLWKTELRCLWTVRKIAPLDRADHIVPERRDLGGGRVIGRLGYEQADLDRLVDDQAPHPLVVPQRRSEGDRAPVGVADQRERLARGVQHRSQSIDLVVQPEVGLAQPSRTPTVPDQVGGDQSVALSEPFHERAPLP